MDAVQAEQPLRVTFHRSRSDPNLLKIEPRFLQYERIVGRAVHRFQNIGNLLLVFFRYVVRHHLQQVGMEARVA